MIDELIEGTLLALLLASIALCLLLLPYGLFVMRKVLHQVWILGAKYLTVG